MKDEDVRSGMIVTPDPRAKRHRWTRAKVMYEYEDHESGYRFEGSWYVRTDEGKRVLVHCNEIMPAVQNGEILVDW